MLRNYIKIAFRNLWRNKTYTLINVTGLGIGIAAFVLIFQYISLERGVNQFHTQLPSMYRILCQSPEGANWPQVEPGWAAKAATNLPELKSYCRFAEGIAQGIVRNEANQRSFREENLGYVEGNFFTFFSFPLLSGNPRELEKPDVAFLSESYARKYFGTQDALGKVITLFNQFGRKEYTIGGVYADMGQNSDIRFDMVLSLETLKQQAITSGNDWAKMDNDDNQFINLFVTLKEGTDYHAFEKKLTALRRQLQTEKDAIVFRVQPAAEIHLASSFSDTLQHTGNVRYVYMLLGIAFLILLIAWFNYINLSTSTSLKRANEVGVRKVIGATQRNLIFQFLGESVLVNLLALLVGLLLVTLMQPLVNQITGKTLSLSLVFSSSFSLLGVGLLVGGSLASGAYTAFVLANFKPIETLKGHITKSAKGMLLRKSLVVSQFGISIALILFTILIYNQLQYMQTQSLGVNMSQLLVIKGPEIGKDSTYANRKTAFLNELSRQSFVKDYCTSGSIPGRWYNFSTAGFTSPKSGPKAEEKSYAFAIIGDRYLQTYDIPLRAGRNFTAAECAVDWNDNSKILINERAMHDLGFDSAEEATRTKIKWDERYLEIIGVVQDYHHTSLQKAIDPIIFYPQNSSSYFSVQLTPDHLSEKIATLGKLYQSQFIDNPFEYFFADDNFNQSYTTERQYGSLFTTASLVAIFIACLGLFGLATFTVESRTKEIGIRKVLGASVLNIATLLSTDFLKLVFLALLIASPIAYYFMHQWLQDFAYKVDIQWWMFAVTGAATLLIAVVTISFKAIKTALANPVKSLRSE